MLGAGVGAGAAPGVLCGVVPGMLEAGEFVPGLVAAPPPVDVPVDPAAPPALDPPPAPPPLAPPPPLDCATTGVAEATANMIVAASAVARMGTLHSVRSESQTIERIFCSGNGWLRPIRLGPQAVR